MPPHRQHGTLPTPIGIMSFDARTLHGLADAILKRMRDNRTKTAAGSYLLGDSAGHIYLVAEGSSTGHAIVRDHEHLIVGRYAATTASMQGRYVPPNGVQYPSPKDLADDLRAYYAEIGR